MPEQDKSSDAKKKRFVRNCSRCVWAFKCNYQSGRNFQTDNRKGSLYNEKVEPSPGQTHEVVYPDDGDIRFLGNISKYLSVYSTLYIRKLLFLVIALGTSNFTRLTEK